MVSLAKKALKKLYRAFINAVPLDRKLILFESVDFGDNPKAVYDRMCELGIDKDYRIVWKVKYPQQNNFGDKKLRVISYDSSLKNRYYTSRAAITLYSHSFAGAIGKKGQRRYFLTHGIPIKDVRGCYWQPEQNTDITCTSEEAAALRCKSFGGGENIVRLTGFPRNDILFRHQECRQKIGLEDGQKLIVWMPTFKHHAFSSRNDLAEGVEQDMRLLNPAFMEKINRRLADAGAQLIIKFHPSQNMQYVSVLNYSNIKSYTNQDLRTLGYTVYELLAASDALITDFSSVYLDYLLCNRPIGFDLSDMEVYSRGFLVEDPKAYMPGSMIHAEADFEAFIRDVLEDSDCFQEERVALMHRMHKHIDGHSADRVLMQLGLLPTDAQTQQN